MQIDKRLFLSLREVATATCGNAYLMDNGRILTSRQFRELSGLERTRTAMFYKYSTNQVIKI